MSGPALAAPVAAVMPFEQQDILQIAPEYLRLQASAPAVRVLSPAGDPCWLVTRHAEVKSLIADRRIGRAHRDPKHASRVSQSLLLGGPVGDFEREHEMHDQVRRLLAPAFTARRTALLKDFITDRATDLVERIAAEQQPVDLHQHLSFRLPLWVICTLLGVPDDEWAQFEGISHGIAEAEHADTAAAAMLGLVTFMQKLLETKRATPGDDLVSDLLRVGAGEGVDPQTLSFVAASLLFAGHETIASRIDFGVLMLLEDPVARAVALTDEASMASCAEEILRLSTPNDLGQARYARTDIALDDIVIAAGDAVILAIGAANRDPAVFADPLRLDVTRRPNPHLSFGFGKHFCLGASLARLELAIVLRLLFQRLPKLRLGVARDELRLRNSQVTGGIIALPVSW